MSDEDLRTDELNRLDLLIQGVRALRQDLAAYRLLLARYMRRGTGAVAALILVGLLLAALGWQAITTQRTTDTLIEEMRRNEEEHRVRNEQLHACLVELVYAVITTPREDRQGIPNPCPEPLPAHELEQG